MHLDEFVTQLESVQSSTSLLPSAETSVFIERVREFEDLYQMAWYDFAQKYDQQKLGPIEGERRLDFAEWYMLCQRFSDELAESITIVANAPPIQTNSCTEKGPSDRAFSLCYTWRYVVTARGRRSA